jgi:predicted TIM-barrel fold metal-dependent hydrolase
MDTDIPHVRTDAHCHLFTDVHLAAADPIPASYSPRPTSYSVRDHAQALLSVDSKCDWIVVNAHLSVFKTSDNIFDAFDELAALKENEESRFDYSHIHVLGLVGATQALANLALLDHPLVIGCRLQGSKLALPDLTSSAWQALFRRLQHSTPPKCVDIYCRASLDELEKALDAIPAGVPVMLDHFAAFAPTPTMESYDRLLQKLRARSHRGGKVVLKGWTTHPPVLYLTIIIRVFLGPGYRSSSAVGFTSYAGVENAAPFLRAAESAIGKAWCLTNCTDAPHVLGFRYIWPCMRWG